MVRHIFVVGLEPFNEQLLQNVEEAVEIMGTPVAKADDFQSIAGETEWERTLEREGWAIRTVTRTKLTASDTHFTIRADLDAYENGERIFCRSWNERIRRDLV